MMTIRAEQMEALRREALLSFRRRLHRRLAEALPARGVVYAPEALEEQIRRGIERCGAYGLTREADVARCIELVCGFLGGFTERPLPPRARYVLHLHGITPEEKLDRLQRICDAGGRAPGAGGPG